MGPPLPLSATANNALYRWGSSRTATAYASDGQNRYTAAGANSLTYDGRANTTSTGLATFAYDGLNRMTSASPATTLTYDALGRLRQVAGSATTRFLYDGQQIIAEYSSTGVLLRKYVPGPGLDSPQIWFEGTATASSSARWLLANGFGSIVATSTSGTSGVTVNVNTYDEFGVSAAGNVGRFQYKGMPYISEVGLYHARARTYSQYLGRFLQPDPSGYGAGMNLYPFGNNSPINSSDPLGLCPRNPGPHDPPCVEPPTLPEIHVPGSRPPPWTPPQPNIPYQPPPVHTPPMPALPTSASAAQDQNGRSLNDCEKNTLAPYIDSTDLNAANLHNGTVPGYLLPGFTGITRGNDIYFRPGVYDPSIPAGLAVLGHELVHVGQYREGMTWSSYL